MLCPDLKPAVFLALPALASLALAGCTSLFYDDRCGVESRQVIGMGVMFTTSGDTLGTAEVTVAESHEDDGQEVWWMIAGSRLRGHVDTARLVASAAPESILIPLPGVPAEPDIVIDGQLRPYVGPVAFNQLFEWNRTGALSVVLDTDFRESSTITIPLEQVFFQDWDRPHCS
jgi:hypothetical protein